MASVSLELSAKNHKNLFEQLLSSLNLYIFLNVENNEFPRGTQIFLQALYKQQHSVKSILWLHKYPIKSDYFSEYSMCGDLLEELQKKHHLNEFLRTYDINMTIFTARNLSIAENCYQISSWRSDK